MFGCDAIRRIEILPRHITMVTITRVRTMALGCRPGLFLCSEIGNKDLSRSLSFKPYFLRKLNCFFLFLPARFFFSFCSAKLENNCLHTHTHTLLLSFKSTCSLFFSPWYQLHITWTNHTSIVSNAFCCPAACCIVTANPWSQALCLQHRRHGRNLQSEEPKRETVAVSS